MANAGAQMFMGLLEAKGLHGRMEDGEDETVVRCGWKLENTDLSLVFSFDNDGSYLSIYGYDFIKVKPDLYDKIVWVVNECNSTYRFVKFILNKERGEIMLKIDAVVQLDSIAEEAFELMVRSGQIVDDAYPEFMKAMWA